MKALGIKIIGLMLIASLVQGGFPAKGLPAESTSRSSSSPAKTSVSYDLAKLLATLAELTGWPVSDWPAPQILQSPSEAFQGWTQLNRHSYFGQYDPEKNRVFLNLNCLSKFSEYPAAYCQAVLFHELVHWGQYHSGIEEEMSGSEQEYQATDYEKRFVRERLGILDMFPPPAPNRVHLPQRMMPIRVGGLPRRVLVTDVAGQRHGLWIVTGRWVEARTMTQYEAEVIHHDEHWVGVRIFQVEPPRGRRLVEAWWDAGYIPPRKGVSLDIIFPTDPVYRARWVQVR